MLSRSWLAYYDSADPFKRKERGRIFLKDVRLVERVDAQNHARNDRCVFPRQKLGAKRARHENVADVSIVLQQVVFVSIVNESDDLNIRKICRKLMAQAFENDGKKTRALLTRGLGNQLLCPVGQTHNVGSVRDESQLVAHRAARAAPRIRPGFST